MYDTSDLRKGAKINIDGQPYIVVDFQFVKPGKGVAFTRTKMKNMITGSILERTYRQGEKFEKADMEERQMEYLYPEGELFVFMDQKTYDQVRLTAEQLGENKFYLLDNLVCDVLLFDGKPIGISPPIFVELKVTATEPGFKGDTSSGGSKPATMQTGLKISVPLFVNEGELLKVDTRTGEYVERVKK
ncbi:MAG: elongation factor P [Sandaracinaceae bacterium]|jgi:elongation factor P|nr:elongation factor P [Sandaracinaceae bacterium]